MVYDSLQISFGATSDISISLNLEAVNDERGEKPHFIGVFEIKKYLFVPVDKYITIERPIGQEISNLFEVEPYHANRKVYKLTIREFDLGIRSQLFSKRFFANVNIGVFEKGVDGSFQQTGILLYENAVSPKGGSSKVKQGYEALLDEWKRQFSSDMLKVAMCPQLQEGCEVTNFIAPSFSTRNNLLLNAESYFWVDSWLVDGEIIFSRPEALKRFYRRAYCLRYRKDPKFQSFESSISNDQYYIRLNRNFVLVTKSKLYFGINLWNEDEYKGKGFEDVFIFDYSIGQSINFNPYFSKGFTGSIGLMGNVTYIYSEFFTIRPFLSLQVGIKL